MIKIFYIANIRLPTEKAHGLAVMKMCESLARKGVKVELVVPSRLNNIKEDPFEYYGVEENFKITKLWCLDLVSWGKVGFWIETLTFAERAAWYVMFKKGIFYTRDEFMAFYLKIFGKKVYWEAHTAKNVLWATLLKGLNGIVTISNGLKDHYVSLGINSDRILVAHSGVDSSQFDVKKSKEEIRRELFLPIEKKIIAYIGKRKTMGESKGVEELEDAFKSISKEYPDTYLLIVTEAPLSQVPLYMKASDVLVMNYPNTEHYAKYMSPLKLFEYMASGTPIVTSDLPSIREILDDNMAYFSIPDNTESLVQKINHVLANEKETKEKAKKSLGIVKDYTWEKRAEKIKNFIT